MRRLFSQPGSRRFLQKYVIPVGLIALAIGAALFVPLLWSKTGTDRIALHRQESLVELVVSKLQSSVAHDQESATYWDDAVEKVQARDMEWIDANLGLWMHTYFGHDGAFVLDPENRAIFSSFGGKVIDNSTFAQIEPATLPMLNILRGKLARSDTSDLNDRVLSPGISDLGVFLGRPAIVSIKPIVSDTGEIVQTPGKEYLHVAIRLLDGTLINELRDDYLFDELRFAWTNAMAADEASVTLRTSKGDTLGYLIWHPYRPGSDVTSRLAPILIGVFVVILAILAALVLMIRRRSVKLVSKEETIRHLALHDTLTGLPNRASFEETLDREIRRAKHRLTQVAVLYLDLDRFKQVNDSLGHPAGDQLITQFASRLKLLVRSGDLVARVGGDEFTIILPRSNDLDELQQFCTRIIDAIRKPFDIDGSQVFIGVSIGVARTPEDGMDRIELTRKADIALYSAKTSGRSRFAIFAPGMDATIQRRRTIEQDLREALRLGEQLEVYYQPLHSADRSEIVGVEALLRWNHPTAGAISPELFIPIAEETGLIEKIGELVLREACNTAASWSIRSVAVNVSAIELRNPAFATRVASILMASGLQPQRLELEVTESALTDNSGSYQENVAALREMGVRIALDDFGTGFSSLARLQHLEVDRIKIDRSFVNGFGKSGSDEAIVQAIVDLARAIGLKTTAEGVETREQQRVLRDIGCDDLQGYLLGRPMRRAEIEQLLVGNPERSAAGG